MQIMKTNSPSFGSIQVKYDTMSDYQKQLSDRVFAILKYSDKYAKHTANNLDIYILPKTKSMIELRIMDPFSGFFIRDNKGKIVKEQISNIFSEKLDTAIDSILDTYDKVMQRIMPRPKENLAKIMAGDTEMARVNPDRQELLNSVMDEGLEVGYTRSGAFDRYKETYHSYNHDADFEVF